MQCCGGTAQTRTGQACFFVSALPGVAYAVQDAHSIPTDLPFIALGNCFHLSDRFVYARRRPFIFDDS